MLRVCFLLRIHFEEPYFLSCIIEIEVRFLGVEVDVLWRVEIVKFRGRTICKRNLLKGNIQVTGGGILERSDCRYFLFFFIDMRQARSMCITTVTAFI